MISMNVELGDRSYTILIKSGILKDAGQIISSEFPVQKTATIITNTTIAPLYLQTVVRSLQKEFKNINTIIIPDGENTKCFNRLRMIYEKLSKYNLDRKSPIIALGGGVVGDITGFAASTFLRGIPFIQIPTTLLAQVDSSVGGKTGINLPTGKNLIGTFYQPSLVIIDPQVLSTLKKRELLSGMAEVIKYAVIRDENFFKFLMKNINEILMLDMDKIKKIIKKSCRIKAHIVSQDEMEEGIRAYLNFGHTIGHSIETLTNYRYYKHGEAVAIGMAAAAKMAAAWGFCSFETYIKIKQLIEMTGLKTKMPKLSYKQYIKIIKKDKKKIGEQVRLVLPKRIGEVFIKEMEIKDVELALKNELK